jgi:hypothetical protein
MTFADLQPLENHPEWTGDQQNKPLKKGDERGHPKAANNAGK